MTEFLFGLPFFTLLRRTELLAVASQSAEAHERTLVWVTAMVHAHEEMNLHDPAVDAVLVTGTHAQVQLVDLDGERVTIRLARANGGWCVT